MIIKLANLACYFADLPALQAILGVQHHAMLLLELPQLGVDIESATEVCLPLPMAILRQIPANIPLVTNSKRFFSYLDSPEPVEELLGLL